MRLKAMSKIKTTLKKVSFNGIERGHHHFGLKYYFERNFFKFFKNHLPLLEEVIADDILNYFKVNWWGDHYKITEPLPSLKKIRGNISIVRFLLKAPAQIVETLSINDLDPPTVEAIKDMKNKIKSFELKDYEKIAKRSTRTDRGKFYC